MPREPTLPRTYRPTTAGRIVMGVLTLLLMTFSLLVIVALATSGRAPSEWVVASIWPAIAAAVLGGFTFAYLRCRIEADLDGVRVVNYVGTHRFGWAEIARFEVGFAYWGATLVPREGAPIKMNAVQKSNLNHWLKRRARADAIVEELNAILAVQQGPPVPPPPPGALP